MDIPEIPTSQDSVDKPVIPQETEAPTDKSTEEAPEIEKPSSDPSPNSDESLNLNKIRQQVTDAIQKDPSDPILPEIEIKKEILSEEEASDYTDGAPSDTDEQRLVIDETGRSKVVAETSGSKSSEQSGKTLENKEVPIARVKRKAAVKSLASPSADSLNESASIGNSTGSAGKPSRTSARRVSLNEPGPSKPSTSKKRSPLKIVVRKERIKPKISTKEKINVSGSSLDQENIIPEGPPPDKEVAGPSKSPQRRRVTIKTEEASSLWEVPFEQGWKRQVVLRQTAEPSPKRKPPADVYYFAPGNIKLRSMPEILHFLRNHPLVELTSANFTFLKEPIYHEPDETVRQAAHRGVAAKSPATPKAPVIKTPKPKKPPKTVVTPTPSPVVEAEPKSKPLPPVVPEVEAPVVPPAVSPVVPEVKPPTVKAVLAPVVIPLPLPLFESSPIMNTKRWRKRKALPPDFLNTDQALSQRHPKEPPKEPPRLTAQRSTTSETKTSGSPKESKEVLQPSKIANSKAPASHATKRKIIVSTDHLGPAIKKAKLFEQRRGTPAAAADGGIEKNGAGNKVVFTFSRMAAGPLPPQNQHQNNSVYTFVRVNPMQNPCTLSCPGLQGQVPDLHCSVCLLLFHSQCVGSTADFTCQRCKKRQNKDLLKLAPKPDMNGTVPVLTTMTNGDTNHDESHEEHGEEIDTPHVSSEYYGDVLDKAVVEEELEDVDLASDDDDDDFMTVTPEVVMAPSTPLRDTPEPTSSSFPIEPISMFMPPLPPLMRAPMSGLSPNAGVNVQFLPRLTSPPNLTNPMITLAPPFGTASSQLRTLVSQLPPRTIVSQAGAVPVVCTMPSTMPIVTPVPSFLPPLVTQPTMPVNILPNASPVVIGTQVLTPVSISMPGIAKGTVIYTNNPTLRFLLPSSGGMQSFVPNSPVTATPPSDSTTVTTTTSTVSTPIVSTGPPIKSKEGAVTVASKFLVRKKPLVVNMRSRSLCELMLLVGKAEQGQKVKLIDSDIDPPPEPEPSDEEIVEPIAEESVEAPVEQSVVSGAEESGDTKVSEAEAMDLDKSEKDRQGEVESQTGATSDLPVTSDLKIKELPAGDDLKTEGETPVEAKEENLSSLEVLSNEPKEVLTSQSGESGEEVARKTSESDVLTSQPPIESKEPLTNQTSEPEDPLTNQPTEPLSNQPGESEELLTNQPSESKEALTNQPAESKDSLTNQPSELEEVLESKTAEPEEAPLSESETSLQKEASEASKDPVVASSEDSVPKVPTEEPMEVLEPFSPIFTEEELREWDRESVSSNDDEEEYRPKSPVVLCAQPFQDGYTRIRSTALSNRGAELSCPKGNCARISCYRRPVMDLYNDQEHAYCTLKSRQLFKQAGRKRMMTMIPPKRAFHQLQGSCDAFSNIFDYLSAADLLRASRVCRTWRKLASQPHQWATVKLKGLKVNNWKTCAKNLEFYGTTMLDMHGFEQDATSWHQFLSHVHHLRKLQGIVFGCVPAWVLQTVVISLPQLLCLEAEYIDPVPTKSPVVHREKDKKKKTDPSDDHLAILDLGWFATLPHLTVLRVRAPQGMSPSSFSPQGSFRVLSTLTSLTHLSLTSLRSFPNREMDFLERLTQLQVLELGQCQDWNDQAYQRLGKLRSLRRLRLELGGAQGDRGLANALGHMGRLEELTLLSFKITTSLAASIRRLRHLWHLTIWPDMSSEGAMIVYNTLQAVRSLKKLQSFSWGIIFSESKSTRYSKKSTKYREATDVHEWWSGELRKGQRAKSIKIPLLKAFSDETPTSATTSSKGGAVPNNSMEQGLIGVGHLKHKLNKCLPDVEIYVYQVPETLLSQVYGAAASS